MFQGQNLFTAFQISQKFLNTSNPPVITVIVVAGFSNPDFLIEIAATELIPLLRKSEAGLIVNVTSDLSSLTLQSDPTWKFYPFKSAGYSVSKTALNGYTIMLAFGLKDTNIKVNAVNPGHTATDFNNHRGDKTPDQTAAVIVKYATIDNDGPSGKFFNAEGEMPW